MAHLTTDALAHFERHHGVASLDHLVELGVSRHTVKRLCELGTLEPVLQGAYRLRGSELTELTRCAAVCIAHPDSAIAGPTAGRLWGFRRLPRDQRIHTLSPPHSHPTVAPWVRPYRTAAFHDEDLVRRPDGITVTSRPRTAADLARFLDDTDLRSVIEQAMHDGPHSVEEMRRVAADWMSPRRRWIRRYLMILDRRVDGAAAESHPETELGDALAQAGVRGLVRQYAVDLPEYGRARFDLAVPELCWAIEVDVFPTHAETAGRLADRRRDVAAAQLGWTVSRVPPSGFGDALPATVAGLVARFHQLVQSGPRSGER